MGRVIRDSQESPNPRTSLLRTQAAVAAELARQRAVNPGARVLGPYQRFPLNTGDLASSSGVLIDMSELADDVKTAIGSGGSGGVPATRRVDTAAPLTGGGDLSADRTIAFPNEPANTVLAGPLSGAPAQPTFRALTPADIPGGSLNVDDIVTSENTDVFDTEGDEVPLVVIDESGNVVVSG